MAIKKPYIIHVLLHAESPEDVHNASATYRTVALGFPGVKNVNFYLTKRAMSLFDFPDDDAGWPVSTLDEPDPVSVCKLEHTYLLTEVIAKGDPSFTHIVLDGDLIFVDEVLSDLAALLDPDCQALIAGQYVQEARRSNMLWMARIHTHFMVFPDLNALRIIIDNCPYHTPWTPWEPIKPKVVFERNQPIFYDTMADLFQVLSGWDYQHVANFTPNFHDKYIHIGCGSCMSYIRSNLSPLTFQQLDARHTLANSPSPTSIPLLLQSRNDYNAFMFQ